jgi:hypothetical protein
MRDSCGRRAPRVGAGTLRRAGLAAGGALGVLVALELLGLVATLFFRAELAAAAEAAGVAGMLPQ